jgi:hypothetical protein
MKAFILTVLLLVMFHLTALVRARQQGPVVGVSPAPLVTVMRN